MKAAVLGAGNTGYAAAAYLGSLGCQVTLYTRDERKAQALNSAPIKAAGVLEGSYQVSAATSIPECIEGASHIYITTTANAHHETLRALHSHLQAGQVVLILNGNWGAYEASLLLQKDIEKNQAIVGESAAMPFLAAKYSNNEVYIKAIKEQTAISLINRNEKIRKKVLEELAPYFRGLSLAANILETTLSSTNPIIHGPIALMNLTRIESGEDYFFYGPSCTRRCVDYVEHLDEERLQVAKALGIKTAPILEAINSFWPVKYDNLYDALHENESYKSAIGPKSFAHRYITEDIPFGIVPISRLGRLLALETPYTDALLRQAALYLQMDLEENGISFSLEDLRAVGAK